MTKQQYADMQRREYEKSAARWSLVDMDQVVGSFNAHNRHADYENFLLNGFNKQDMIALDFGCGPGRNLVRFGPQFKRMDGVDIVQKNLDNAKLWLMHNKLWNDDIRLIHCNGIDLSNIEDNFYDLILSTITLQHICVHAIRFDYFKEFYRTLKPSGWITLQMGYGPKVDPRQKAEYYDDYYEAEGTNGFSDTMVTSPNQLSGDLEKIGFKNFHYDIRPVGPGDKHPNWIFFRAQK
jgi:ubiquinone/menaquinone biosynthesis C-methylase UbiE